MLKKEKEDINKQFDVKTLTKTRNLIIKTLI